MQDWTGNKKTTFSTLGASSHANHERESRDYYATPPIAGEHLIKAYPKINNIWECSVGEGHLIQKIKHLVTKESDIVVRSYPCEEIDFLKSTHKHDGWIVTNPPFSYALEFVENALSLASKGVAMFLRIQFLESVKRQRLFTKNPPSFVYIYSKRCPECRINGSFDQSKTGGNAAAYGWFIWDKEISKSEPIIRWINM